jgi:uncharacterized protein YcnI
MKTLTLALTGGLMGVLTALTPSTASAHVTLQQPSVTTGSYYKATLMVGHGCTGGQPTHTVTVRIPAGFRGAKPMPKPGWALTVKREPLAQPYTSHGRTVTEDTTEVVWTARSEDAWLADAHYDEFTLRGQVGAAPGPMWLKVRQDCPTGRLDWSEVPADGGSSTKGLASPAALLTVEPAPEAGHAHHH